MLEPGLKAAVELTVTEADTAVALGSGDVPVLGTPRVLALMEAAAVKALEGRLEPGQTTVGISADLRHLAPTPVGGRVRAEARLIVAEGRNLGFEISLRDASGSEVATAHHRRSVVDRERFLSRL